MDLLTIKNVSKHFGGLMALKDVSIHIKAGEITVVIGPNGAGKTTLFNVITGFHKADTGSIHFRGERIENLPPQLIARRGILRTFQLTRLFSQMTVLENVLVGRHLRTKADPISSLFGFRFVKQEEVVSRKVAMEALQFVGLEHLANTSAGTLPHGQQRLLEIARAMAAEPELLLLDEPTTGLNHREVKELQEKIKQIIRRSISVVLVEHDMRVVMSLADNIHVLDYGGKIAEGPPEVIKNDPAVIAAYLGGESSC